MADVVTFDEATKNKLLDVVEKFEKTRNEGLAPVFEELRESIRRGVLRDAYQARYLRDSLVLTEGEADRNKDILDQLEATFFG